MDFMVKANAYLTISKFINEYPEIYCLAYSRFGDDFETLRRIATNIDIYSALLRSRCNIYTDCAKLIDYPAEYIHLYIPSVDSYASFASPTDLLQFCSLARMLKYFAVKQVVPRNIPQKLVFSCGNSEFVEDIKYRAENFFNANIIVTNCGARFELTVEIIMNNYSATIDSFDNFYNSIRHEIISEYIWCVPSVSKLVNLPAVGFSGQLYFTTPDVYEILIANSVDYLKLILKCGSLLDESNMVNINMPDKKFGIIPNVMPDTISNVIPDTTNTLPDTLDSWPVGYHRDSISWIKKNPPRDNESIEIYHRRYLLNGGLKNVYSKI